MAGGLLSGQGLPTGLLGHLFLQHLVLQGLGIDLVNGRTFGGLITQAVETFLGSGQLQLQGSRFVGGQVGRCQLGLQGFYLGKLCCGLACRLSLGSRLVELRGLLLVQAGQGLSQTVLRGRFGIGICSRVVDDGLSLLPLREGAVEAVRLHLCGIHIGGVGLQPSGHCGLLGVGVYFKQRIRQLQGIGITDLGLAGQRQVDLFNAALHLGERRLQGLAVSLCAKHREFFEQVGALPQVEAQRVGQAGILGKKCQRSLGPCWLADLRREFVQLQRLCGRTV